MLRINGFSYYCFHVSVQFPASHYLPHHSLAGAVVHSRQRVSARVDVVFLTLEVNSLHCPEIVCIPFLVQAFASHFHVQCICLAFLSFDHIPLNSRLAQVTAGGGRVTAVAHDDDSVASHSLLATTVEKGAVDTTVANQVR